jgi:WD40 repeat protein
MASGDAYDVFISYARSDGNAAAELNGWLCAQGFSTFFDRSALRPGLRWISALEEAIGRAKAVAILVGKQGIGNTQQYERELALVRQSADAAFPVIPVLLPGCDSPPTGFLRLLTWVDLSKGNGVREHTDGLEVLRAALRRETVAASPVRSSICPYRGLEPFREEDAAFFCGRDDAIRELVARVQAHTFVAVVGPSGSGKSSLVFAGLLPALRKQGRTTMWDVIELRPGKSPLRALAEGFGAMPDNAGPAEIDARLEKEAAFYRAGGSETLARIVDRRLDSAPEKPDRLLIYVDQWEELHAMAPAAEDTERRRQHSADVEKFVEALIGATSPAGSRASVVLTVRADFYNPLIRNPLLAALLPKQQVNIPPMSRDDLRSAIETPAKTAGLSFAPPELVDRILDDVGLEEGRLPLLQFALKETWQRREGDRLTAEAYTEVGGVAHAIEKTAEDSYERLKAVQKDAARRLFLRLVTPGEGQADTRARSAIPDDPGQRDIVNLFSNPKTRLLVTALQASGAGVTDVRATVEVAHEALIQRWPTLRNWVRANRENLRARAAILRAKAEWEEHGEDDKYLLDPGVQLERGRALLANPGDVAVDDIRDFLGRSIEKDERRLAAERDKALAEQKRIADTRKRTAQVAVVGLVVALLVAAAAVWQYFDANRAKTAAIVAKVEAEASAEQAKANLRDAQIAQSRFLADKARQARMAGDAGVAALLALEALPDGTTGMARPYVAEAELQLDGGWRGLRERLVLSHVNVVNSSSFSPDGTRIVTASDDHTARIWDAASGKPIGEPLRGHSDKVNSASFSPDGMHIVTASDDHTVRIWDATSGKPIGEPLSRDDKVLGAGFSPDGRRIVTASADKTVRLWDAATGQPIGEPLGAQVAVFSPDGRRVLAAYENAAQIVDATTGRPIGAPVSFPGGYTVNSARYGTDGARIITSSDDYTVRVWDATTGRPIGEPVRFPINVNFEAQSPDGTRILSTSLDNTARVWDVASGEPVGEPLKGHEGRVNSAVFSPDGKRIVTTSWDKTARLWDAASGKPIGEPFRGHVGDVTGATFSPDGNRIVTVAQDDTARVWDAASGAPIGELGARDSAVNGAAFSPDGRRVVTASSRENVARVWDAASGKEIGEPLRGHEEKVWSAAFSPDGARIVTASDDKTARLWDAASQKPIGEPLKGHADRLRSVAFSPDGRRIVTASWDKTARIWDAASGKPIGEPLSHDDKVLGAGFSPDGRRIVTASADKTARIWDAASGKEIGEPLNGHADAVLAAAFSPDGTRIVTASQDKTARIWDAASGKPIGEPLKGHEDRVLSAAFSPDGTRIVTASADKTARIWDAASEKEIGELKGHKSLVITAAFSPDGKRIVTASWDGTARLWDVFANSDSLESYAKAAVPRCLTPAQRKAFFLSPEPPAWCIEMEKWPYNTPAWEQWLADVRAGKKPGLPTGQ